MSHNRSAAERRAVVRPAQARPGVQPNHQELMQLRRYGIQAVDWLMAQQPQLAPRHVVSIPVQRQPLAAAPPPAGAATQPQTTAAPRAEAMA